MWLRYLSSGHRLCQRIVTVRCCIVVAITNYEQRVSVSELLRSW
jgi:hypothetical protein